MANTISLAFDQGRGAGWLGRLLGGVAASGRGAKKKRALTLIGVEMQRAAQSTFRQQRDPETGARWKPIAPITLRSRPGGGGNGKALVDTGALLRDLVSTPPQQDADSVSIGTNLVYARLHQHGGVVRPRRAKFLTIPLTREAGRSKSLKRWLDKNKGQAFIRKSRKGNLIAFKSAKHGRPYPHWLLVESVRVPARPFLGWPRDGSGDRMVEKIVAQVIESAWKP